MDETNTKIEFLSLDPLFPHLFCTVCSIFSYGWATSAVCLEALDFWHSTCCISTNICWYNVRHSTAKPQLWPHLGFKTWRQHKGSGQRCWSETNRGVKLTERDSSIVNCNNHQSKVLLPLSTDGTLFRPLLPNMWKTKQMSCCVSLSSWSTNEILLFMVCLKLCSN